MTDESTSYRFDVMLGGVKIGEATMIKDNAYAVEMDVDNVKGYLSQGTHFVSTDEDDITLCGFWTNDLYISTEIDRVTCPRCILFHRENGEINE